MSFILVLGVLFVENSKNNFLKLKYSNDPRQGMTG